MNLWDEILARIETKVNRHSFYTWFRPTTFVTDDRSSVTVRVPNALFKDWLTKHYAGVISEAMGELKRPNLLVHFVSDTQSDVTVIPLSADEAAALETGPPPSTQPGPAGLNPALHLRHLHRRIVESVRARRVPRGRRGAVALLQPAVHLRRRGSRQDASDARGRALRAAARSQSQAHLHLVRAIHERDDQRGPLRSRARFPRALSIGRRAARRRHPVSRRQGRHADRVLPHLQRAVRFAEADRAEQRLSAARDSGARGAPALALRVGPDRRHSVAGSRDEGRDSQAESGNRSGAAARQRRDVHRRQDQVEHPRARGIADSPHRVRVADRPGDHAAARRRKC